MRFQFHQTFIATLLSWTFLHLIFFVSLAKWSSFYDAIAVCWNLFRFSGPVVIGHHPQPMLAQLQSRLPTLFARHLPPNCFFRLRLPSRIISIWEVTKSYKFERKKERRKPLIQTQIHIMTPRYIFFWFVMNIST